MKSVAWYERAMHLHLCLPEPEPECDYDCNLDTADGLHVRRPGARDAVCTRACPCRTGACSGAHNSAAPSRASVTPTRVAQLPSDALLCDCPLDDGGVELT